MYKLIVGRISRERQENWFCKDDNPYAVWEDNALIQQICTIGTPAAADEHLRDRVDIDWGSIAWKGNKQELTRFFREHRFNVSALQTLDPSVDYAVVFIETVWGDSV